MPNSLTRWDPFSELQNFRSAMDRQFEQMFGRPMVGRGGEELQTHTLGLDVIETNDSFTVKAALPGIDPKDVEISIDDDVLTIRGEKKFERKDDKENYHFVERSYGTFQRSLRLPYPVDSP